MKIVSLVRNNWKKSIFGLGLGTYAINYGREMYQISSLLKSYSGEAAAYGDQCGSYPKKIIVILNPAANKKKAEKTFSKYCEPIFHLAGFTVDIIRTDSEGHAKVFVEHLKSLPYGIVVAGGDGTVSEVLTGLMRRNNNRCPIALLPLGIKNETTKNIFNLKWSSKVKEVEELISTSLNIVRGNTQPKSVFKIEQIANENVEHSESRPIFSMGFLEWGMHRDIKSLQEKYWYFWKADKYISALVYAVKSKLSWNCKADVTYTAPCIGCSNCIVSEKEGQAQGSILSRLFYRKPTSNSNAIQISNNPACEKKNIQYKNASNVRIYVDETSDKSRLVMESEKTFKTSLYSFLKHLAEEKELELLKFRSMTLIPDESCMGPSKLYSIDNEAYDVRPINVTLIPKAVEIFI